MIRRLREAWERYWFEPAPLVNLAVCRIAVAGYQLWIWARLDQAGVLAQRASLPDFMYDPLPVLHALIWPLGWTYRPGMEVLEAVHGIALVSGALAVLGLLTRPSLAVFAVTSVFLQAHDYSFGDFHHPEAPVMIALAVLALAPAGRVLSLDALWRRWRSGEAGGRGAEAGTLSARSPHARWPLSLIVWVLALAYLSGAVSKLATAGLDWMNGYTLQYYLLQDGLRWGAEAGVWLGRQHLLAIVLSWMTILFEGTFFLVLFFPALALIYVPAGIGMHVGIDVTMRAFFYGWIALYAALVPWHGVGVWLKRRLRPGSLRSAAGRSDATDRASSGE